MGEISPALTTGDVLRLSSRLGVIGDIWPSKRNNPLLFILKYLTKVSFPITTPDPKFWPNLDPDSDSRYMLYFLNFKTFFYFLLTTVRT